MYSRHQIPPEIVESIINEETSTPALKRFALVNKTWLFFAQSHLFHKITIGRDRNLFPVQNLIGTDHHITQHVRHVEIWPYVQDKRYAKKIKSTGYDDWKEQLDLAGTLQRLETVHFRRMQEVDAVGLPTDTTLLSTTLHKFQCLTTLMLTSCTFANLQSFENLVLNVPNLKSLSLDMVSWNVSQINEPGLKLDSESFASCALDSQHWLRTSFALETLHIGRYCNLDHIVRWLLTTSSTETLRTLVLSAIPADQLHVAGTLLARVGPTLEHLTLGCKFDGPGQAVLQGQIGHHLSLIANSSLKTLRIRILDSYTGRMQWVPTLLSDLAAPFLTCVTFDIWIALGNQLQDPSWDAIQKVLEQNAQFAGVQIVKFVLRAQAMLDKWELSQQGLTATQIMEMWVAQRFPGLSRRGVLRVVNDADF